MKIELELDEVIVDYWASAHSRNLSSAATPGQQLREAVIRACRKAGRPNVEDWWQVSYYTDDGVGCELIHSNYTDAATSARELMHEGIQDVQIRRHRRGNR